MENDLEKLLKSLEADGLIQARINYKGKQSEFDKEPHGAGVLEQVDNKLYIQALEFTAFEEIEKAIKLLEALLLVEPNHKKGKELLDKLERKEHKTPNLFQVGTQSDRTQDIKNDKKKRRLVRSLLSHLSFFIILVVSLFLDVLAYRANDFDYVSLLLGFIISYIFSYFGYYYREQFDTWINRILNLKIGKQLLVLLLLFIVLIIVLFFKYLVMAFPRSGELWNNIFLFLIFGVPIGCGIGFGLGAFLKGRSK